MAQPFKLLLVVIDLHGGAGVFCRNLATGLSRHFPDGFQISLLLMRPGSVTASDRGTFHQIHELDATVHDDFRRFVEVLPDARRLRKALKTIDSDLILTIHNHPNLLVPLVAPNRKVILSVHGHLSTLLRKSVTRPVLRALIRRRYRDRVVITPTRGVAEDLAQNFNVANTRVIPHGIDIERIQTLASEPAANLPARPYIVSLGRLVREKDYTTLLHAFALARSRSLAHYLAIIGSGELEFDLKQLANALKIDEHVRFLGHLDNPYPHLEHADFFVLSSVSEGFGLALVEAMSLGLPCISTDCPSGPAEILDHGKYGVLVPPQSPDALADAMLQLAGNHDLRQKFSALASARAQDFSLREMARRYRDLFLEVHSG